MQSLSLGCLVSILLTAGCFKSAVVVPTELPRLNGAYYEPGDVLFAGELEVIDISPPKSSVRYLLTPSGKFAEIQGKVEVNLTMRDGQLYSFNQPRFRDLGNGAMTASARNNGGMFRLGDVRRAEVRTRAPEKTVWVVLGAAAAIVVGSAVVLEIND